MVQSAVVALSLLLWATPCVAQEFPPADRHGADWASTAMVGGTIAADVVTSITNARATQRSIWGALGCESLKYAAVNLASLGLKKAVPRERPDGSDNQDSFSEHTANAFASTGWSASTSIPLATLIGVFRIGSGRHDKTGVAEGTSLGEGVRLLVTRITLCKGVS